MKDKKNLWIIIIMVIVAVVAFTAFMLKKGAKAEGNTASIVQQTTTKIKERAIPTEDGKQKSQKAFDDVKTIKIDESNWNLTLLNRNYKLPDGYVPKTAKIKLSDKDPRRTKKALLQELDYRVAAEYQKMYDAAAKDGIYLTPYSGYRSIAYQEQIFNGYVKMYKDKGYSTEQAKYKASNASLPPGTSEHNMGLAMDIINTKEDFEDSKEYVWLEANAHNYGFILRYAKEKTSITNVMYEPWHWRYVGAQAAREMKSSGQCLEEYLKVK